MSITPEQEAQLKAGTLNVADLPETQPGPLTATQNQEPAPPPPPSPPPDDWPGPPGDVDAQRSVLRVHAEDMTTASALFSVYDGDAFCGRSGFSLEDRTIVQQAAWSRDVQPLVTVEQAGCAIFDVGPGSVFSVDLRVEVWTGPPPPDDQQWEQTALHRLLLSGGPLVLGDCDSMSDYLPLDLLDGVTHYHLWAAARGFANAERLERERDEFQGDIHPSYLTRPKHVEQWLVRLWPAQEDRVQD